MAYRDPETLTCRKCGKTGEVVWIVGIGPQTQRGDGPSYKTLDDAGPWRAETTEEHPFWAGRLFCPDCGEIVKRVPESTIRRGRGGVKE
jgi:hypothetical protein